MSNKGEKKLEEGRKEETKKDNEYITPLPKLKVGIVCLIQFCEAFNGNSLFAYVGMRAVHPCAPREEI